MLQYTVKFTVYLYMCMKIKKNLKKIRQILKIGFNYDFTILNTCCYKQKLKSGYHF